VEEDDNDKQFILNNVTGEKLNIDNKLVQKMNEPK
jgi:hypothetical protein